jgi:hypothetical protein
VRCRSHECPQYEMSPQTSSVEDEEMWVAFCDVTADTADVAHGTRKHK